MRTRIALVVTLNVILGLAALGAIEVQSAPRALAADCGTGAVEERLACLEAKIDGLTKQLEAKADAADALKWNDRIALINEDMRIYPRCLDNPGPNSPDLTAVLANSCAKVPAQTWMVSKPYH
jgi:hypothetical protein